MKLAVWLTRLFPLWALLASALALYLPAPLAAWRPAIPWLLGVVMFGMGLTLTAGDFAAALRRPAVLGLGVALQFLCMPLFAWLLARLLGLDALLLAGLVLVGAAPGGTASNVICYLAGGDVALSCSPPASSPPPSAPRRSAPTSGRSTPCSGPAAPSWPWRVTRRG